MENQTSFDLNNAIQQWRENLASSPSFQSENLDELEAHLRDSIAVWEKRGLSTEEAFVIAAKRLGSGASLETEFGKVNEQTVWVDRILWMLLGWQVWTSVSGAASCLSKGAFYLGLIGGNIDLYSHGRMISVIGFTVVQLLALAGSLWFCWWLFARKGQGLSRRIDNALQRRGALIGTSVVVVLLIPACNFLLNSGLEILCMKHLTMTRMGEAGVSRMYGIFVSQMIQGAAFFVLTVLVFRKSILQHRRTVKLRKR